jgi:hypothetical protein
VTASPTSPTSSSGRPSGRRTRQPSESPDARPPSGGHPGERPECSKRQERRTTVLEPVAPGLAAMSWPARSRSREVPASSMAPRRRPGRTRFASRDAASVDPCIPHGASISSVLQTLPLGADSRARPIANWDPVCWKRRREKRSRLRLPSVALRLVLPRVSSNRPSRPSTAIPRGALPMARGHWRTVGSPRRRQTTVARYSGGEHRRMRPPQELRSRRSRRSRTATRAGAPNAAKTPLGRVAADTSSDGACGV